MARGKKTPAVTTDVRESMLYLFDTQSRVVAFRPYFLGCCMDGFSTFPPIFHTHHGWGFFGVSCKGFPGCGNFWNPNLERQANQNTCHSSLPVLKSNEFTSSSWYPCSLTWYECWQITFICPLFWRSIGLTGASLLEGSYSYPRRKDRGRPIIDITSKDQLLLQCST